VHQRYDGWCKDCVDIEQKAKENMEKNISRRNELLERANSRKFNRRRVSVKIINHFLRYVL
jgi:hypothetical protein